MAAGDAVGWDELADSEVRARRVEMLVPTPLTTVDDELADTARDAARRPSARTTAALAVCGLGRATRSSTSRGRPACGPARSRPGRSAQGVCQDIAHLTVGMLRALGLPARYVSGYLHPEPDAAVGEVASGRATPGWSGGPGEWTASTRPTAIPVGERHVVVARGRDYGDVPPLKGVYRGAASTAIGVGVEVERLA